MTDDASHNNLVLLFRPKPWVRRALKFLGGSLVVAGTMTWWGQDGEKASSHLLQTLYFLSCLVCAWALLSLSGQRIALSKREGLAWNGFDFIAFTPRNACVEDAKQGGMPMLFSPLTGKSFSLALLSTEDVEFLRFWLERLGDAPGTSHPIARP